MTKDTAPPAGNAVERLAALEARVHELLDTETRFKLAVESAGIGIWEWRLDTNEMLYSLRAKEICGFPPDGPVTYKMAVGVTHPEDLPYTSAQARRALDPEIRARELYEYRLVRPSGELRWVRAHGEAIFEDGEQGPRAVRYVGTLEDVTEPRTAQAALQASEARLRLALAAGRMAVWSLDASGEVGVTPEFLQLLRLPADSHPTLEDLQSRYYPGELERLRELGQQAFSCGQQFIHFEYRHLWPDGQVRWMLVRAELLRTESGASAGVIGVILDITDRHETEDRLELLAKEVDHRANNLLAIVLGTINMTDAATVADFKERLRARVSALSRAHQLMATSRWMGADLRSLIHEELLPFEGRIELSGPPIELSVPKAQSVAMVIHELATNALKYGALSNPDGVVSICWDSSPTTSDTVITWTELRGPPVTKPTRRGMGSRVLERALSGQAGGRTELDWRPEGLVCRIYLDSNAGR